MGLFFEIMCCALAVFGAWCVLRLVSEALFSSRRIRPSITVFTPQDLARLCSDLGEARVLLSSRRGEPIVVLCDQSLAPDGSPPLELLAACRRHGAVCCVAHLPKELYKIKQKGR